MHSPNSSTNNAPEIVISSIETQGITGLLLPIEEALVTHPSISQEHAAQVSEAKRAIYRSLCEYAEEFNGSSAKLIRTAASLSMRFHFNHFRVSNESQPLHYGIHLLAVSEGVIKCFDDLAWSFPTIACRTDTADTAIKPKAFAIALAMLHDSIEDFSKNFPCLGIESDTLREEARHTIKISLIAEFGHEVADSFLSSLNNLTIENPDDFPEPSYIERIANDPYAHLVKICDVLHNISTAPGIKILYPCTSSAAQASQLFNDTPLKEEYDQGIFRVLACPVAGEEVETGRNWKDVNYFRHMMEDFDRYAPVSGLQRLYEYHQQLLKKLQNGAFDEIAGQNSALNKEFAAKSILTLLNAVEEHIIKEKHGGNN